ncbi:MAG: hypothetical protein ACOC7U_08220, partial [Spirochaetota bacterium]
MLGSVIGQNIAVRMLEHELETGRLPRTLLFFGPDGSGKFFTALELARALNCSHTGPPLCSCTSCSSIARLYYHNLLVITKSNLRNTFDIWKTLGVSENNVELFVRDVRRFLLSISDEESFSKESGAVQELLSDKASVLKGYPEILDKIYRVLDSRKGTNISIDRIRELKRFLSIKTENGKLRVAIIDGAEHMNEEASNSFLKISEDTPQSSIIIIITAYKDLLKETIKSRCRDYRFVKLKETDFRKVLEERLGLKCPGKMRFFPYEPETMEGYYKKLNGDSKDLENIVRIADEISAKERTVGFLDYTADVLRKKLHSIEKGQMEKVYELE